MSPRIFWKFFTIFAALQLATVLSFMVVVSEWQEDQTFRQKVRRLRDAATVLNAHFHPELTSEQRDDVQRRVAQFADQMNMRITVVSIDGTVLADSDEEPESMENHKDRSELAAALESGTGNSQRFSPTLQLPMLYHASRIDTEANEPAALIRVAVPLSEVEAEVSRIDQRLWLVAFAVNLAGLILTYLIVAKALKPVQTLTAAVNAMAAGSYDHRVEVHSSRDELGTLATSFNRMSAEIEARESQLREIVDRMRAVLGGMIEGVFAVDDEQRFLFANQAAGNLLGFLPDAVQGQPLSDTVKNTMLQQVAIDTLQTESGNVVRQLEIANGVNNFVLAVNGARLPGDPCPGAVVVMHDVSELRRLEKLRQEFVANVSHELKTPLSAIMAYAETLRDDNIIEAADRQRFLEQIEEQSQRLDELIQDMLQLARIESGQARYEITTLQIGDLVERCLMAHDDTARAKQIMLAVEPSPPAGVKADEEAIRQILDNLLTNAIKYTPNGGQVAVRWRIEHDEVAIQVEDDGIGIPEEHHARIFERFYRVDKARSRELGGTGLGLSIVKHLAQMLGGSVSIESVPGTGTTFEVRIPAAETAQNYVETAN